MLKNADRLTVFNPRTGKRGKVSTRDPMFKSKQKHYYGSPRPNMDRGFQKKAVSASMRFERSR